MKPIVAPFPATRLRRMRQSPALRALSRQNTLTVDDLIWPVFVMDGKDDETPVASMPGVVRRTVNRVALAAKEAQALGIPAICIFPYTGMEARTEDCAMAWDPNNLTNQAIRAIKDVAPDIAVMTDIALDPYNINGHDGFVENGQIVNDRTVEALVKMALAQADAGADIIDVSSGQTSHQAKPRPGRMFQTPLSDQIRNEAGIATMAVGNIFELDHVNSIIAAGRADLVCLGRAHLADPNWTLRAAAESGHTGVGVHEQKQYYMGFRQLHTNLRRAAEQAAADLRALK